MPKIVTVLALLSIALLILYLVPHIEALLVCSSLPAGQYVRAVHLCSVGLVIWCIVGLAAALLSIFTATQIDRLSVATAFLVMIALSLIVLPLVLTTMQNFYAKEVKLETICGLWIVDWSLLDNLNVKNVEVSLLGIPLFKLYFLDESDLYTACKILRLGARYSSQCLIWCGSYTNETCLKQCKFIYDMCKAAVGSSIDLNTCLQLYQECGNDYLCMKVKATFMK